MSWLVPRELEVDRASDNSLTKSFGPENDLHLHGIMLVYKNKCCYGLINKNRGSMTPADITVLGVTLYDEPWLEKMADALGYSTSQLSTKWSMAEHPSPAGCSENLTSW
jgi:hypothetical protein